MSNSPIDREIRFRAMWYSLANLIMPASVAFSLIFISWISLLVVFTSLIFLLIILLANRRKHPFVDKSAKESLNFTLSIGLYLAIWISIWVGSCFAAFTNSSSPFGAVFMISSFVIPLLFLLHFLAIVLGSIQAAKGNAYKYPLSIRFFR
jgi:uncharacterized protein